MAGMHKDLISRLIYASLPGSTHSLSRKDRETVCHYIVNLNRHRKFDDLIQLSDRDLYDVFSREQNEDYVASLDDWDIAE